MRLVLVPLMAMALAACGQDSKSGGKKDGGTGAGPTGETQQAGAMTFADDAALPACDAAREGGLVYVTATKSFRACSAGKWATIDLKGAAGEKGDAGEKGEGVTSDVAKALELYKTYKRSIFRATLECKLQAPLPAGCAAGQAATAAANATAFLCGDKVACTNVHVISCIQCYEMTRFSLQALDGAGDTVNPDGSPTEAFFSTTSEAVFKTHASKDLAKVTITANPKDAKPLPIATEAAKGRVAVFQSILSMSFPLGFQDLYTDVGQINTPYIGECNNEGGTSGYGCPGELYDFSTTNDTDHGSSGSPLFDIATGEVIGVTTAGTEDENANFTWATDASQFKDVK